MKRIFSGQGIFGDEVAGMGQVMKEVGFLAVAISAVAFYCQNTPVMTALVVGLVAARFALIGRRFDWIFLLVGIVAGGGNDLLSMMKGVYRYTPPHEFAVPIPMWILLFWGYVFVAFRQLFLLPAFSGPARARPPWNIDARLIADLAVVVLFRIIIYNFVRSEPIPTIGYAAVLAARLIVIPPRPHEWRLMAAVIVIGPLYEALLIRFGLYVYSDPVFLGMPAWLLIYWLFIIPLFMKGIFERIEQWVAAHVAPVLSRRTQ